MNSFIEKKLDRCVDRSTRRVSFQQPQGHFKLLNNSFNLLSNEKVYREWYYADSSCCCKDSYHVTLTDIRLLTRHEESTSFTSCTEPSHTDSSIFLRDIDLMRDSRGDRPSLFYLLWLTLSCTWPCYLVRRILCPKPKCLEVLGPFGSESVQLSREDMIIAQTDISTAVINSKTILRS